MVSLLKNLGIAIREGLKQDAEPVLLKVEISYLTMTTFSFVYELAKRGKSLLYKTYDIEWMYFLNIRPAYLLFSLLPYQTYS